MNVQQKIGGIFFLLFTAIANACNAQQIAFPGAEGYGKYVTGGRGTAALPTTILAVTSLADDGSAGTLRWALDQTATYRTIIFKVSGTIHLTSQLKISKSNTTIAGQTAPGDGICIADHTFSVSATNVIVRYMRFRLGDRYQNLGMVDGSGSDDTFNSIAKNNIIIDHCTISWSTDEALSFYGADNLTLQWNLISEPLNYSYHFETGDADWERHGFGGIWGGMHASFHHNLLAHCHGRSPRFDGSRNLGDKVTVGLENADFRNNVMYNWGSYSVNGGEGGNYNIVNNYYKYGPTTRNSIQYGPNVLYEIIQPWKQSPLPYGKYYMAGNYVDGSASVTNNNWLGASMYQGTQADTALSKVTTPFPLLYIPTQTPAEAYADVLKGAGAVLPKRDTLDQRIVNDVKNRTGREIDVQGGYPHGTAYALTVNAWPALNSATPLSDIDNDGMPDEWELRRGLDPNNAADKNGYNANGYSNLENYLNGDSTVATGVNNTCITSQNIITDNSIGWKDAKDTVYALHIPTDTMNIIASIKNDGNYGAFSVSYYVTNTTRLNAGKAYLNRNITITPLSSVSGSLTVRLYFTAAEFNALKAADAGITLNSLKVFRADNNTCVTSVGSNNLSIINPVASGIWGTYANGYYIEFSTDAFGTFFIAANDLALPLDLLSFEGELRNSQVNLSWTTANEIKTKEFVIERRTDGVSFQLIGTVAAKGNSSSVTSYAFTDVNPFYGTSYYRLRMIDKDGAKKYSPVVIISHNNKNVLSVYPNPSVGKIIITHQKAVAQNIFEILSTDGKKIRQFKAVAGSQQTNIDVRDIPSGRYVLVFKNGLQNTSTTVIKL